MPDRKQKSSSASSSRAGASSHRARPAGASAQTHKSPLALLPKELAPAIDESPVAAPPLTSNVGDDFLARLAEVETGTKRVVAAPRVEVPARLPPVPATAPSIVIGSPSAQPVDGTTAAAGSSGHPEAGTASVSTSLAVEVHRELTALDDRLAEVLGRGDIALVRSAWLLTQPPSFRIVRRQDLAPVGTITPLLEPNEAVQLLRKGTRAVGALTYGWPSAGNPDPTGHRLQAVRRALQEQPDIEAFFWDFPSLFQYPRSKEQNKAFKRSLGVVSAAGLEAPHSFIFFHRVLSTVPS